MRNFDYERFIYDAADDHAQSARMLPVIFRESRADASGHLAHKVTDFVELFNLERALADKVVVA